MKAALDVGRLVGVYARVARRYDIQHKLVTAGSDQAGRRLLVERAVRSGDRVLDCGAGTGSTSLLAARKAGQSGQVTLFDLSEPMLAVARERVARSGLPNRFEFLTGDMVSLPFDDDTFDVVLSTYSLCPLYDPRRGALELLRVAKPGGRVGAAHSAEPENPVMRWIARRVEGLVWLLPSLSLGCRAVSVLPALESAGATVTFTRRIGIPLWPFVVFVVSKPVGRRPESG